MNKETFLKELQQHLAVLEDQEQQDILQEYSQHLDIKIQNGQKEEDAIRDFGPVKELAAEILEAYHVKPEFGEGRAGKGLPGLGSVNLKEGEEKIRRLGSSLGKMTSAFVRKIGRLFWKAGQGIRVIGLRVLSLFRRRKETDEAAGTEETAAENGKAFTEGGGAGTREKKGGRKMEMVYERKFSETERPGRRFCEFCRGAARGVGAAVLWCLRMCWNAFWLLAALCVACFALLALFGFGTLLVLLLQSYPLKGGVLVCLGSSLAGGSLAVLCFTLTRWKKRQTDSAAVKEPEEKETDTEEEEFSAEEPDETEGPAGEQEVER